METEEVKDAVEGVSEKPLKPLFGKQQPSEQQVQVISDTQLVNLKLDTVIARLDEILALAKG